MKRIESGEAAVTNSYLRTVLFRSERVKSDVGRLAWLKLLALEFMFGEELLEHLVVTAAYNEQKQGNLGQLLHLTDLVPSGLLTNYFRQGICQLLFFKFHMHYLYLATEGGPSAPDGEDDQTIYLQRTRFGLRHDLLYQIVAFRRVYVIAWVLFNGAVDVLVWNNGVRFISFKNKHIFRTHFPPADN